MSQAAVIRLIHSLSKAEKRQFKLFTKKQSGNKDYMALFDLIEQKKISNKAALEKEFQQRYPGASLDNTTRYLLKILLDSLIQSRVKEYDFYQLLYGLLKVNILKERNLREEGFKELNKLLDMSLHSQDNMIQYIFYREKLNYLSGNNFHEYSEKKLVALQEKARNNLKNIRNVHEHYSLYELLKFRLIHSGKILSEKNKKQLNDLLLSEMGIVNARIKGNLESIKLHLLFQSYFFTDIGDYKSALKTFHELNRLFEKNVKLLSNPPLDYFSALDGILDSLRTNGLFPEMDFYNLKLKELDQPQYPEYFRFLVRKTIAVYRLAMHHALQEYHIAAALIEKFDKSLWEEYCMIDEEKQHELLFYMALTYFYNKEYKKAQKLMNQIILIDKANYDSPVYKAARLLNLIISYEMKDLEYLDYEIRSYKRAYYGNGKALKIESLIFKIIAINPDFNKKVKNDIIWKRIHPLIKSIDKDKFNLQVLKYFDFTGWVKQKFL